MSKQLKYYGSTASFNNLYSINYDGTNEYAIGNAAADIQFTGASDFTASVWIKPDTVTGRRTILYVGVNIAGGLNGYWIYQNGAVIFCTMFFSPRQGEIRTTSNVLSIGVWAHVQFVKTGNNATNWGIYINGSLVSKTVIVNTLLAGDTPAYSKVISGRLPRSPNEDYFDGRIYHPGIANIAVDATQASEWFTKEGGDLRTLSFGSNIKFAAHFPNGQSDYPTWTNYIDGTNLTMTNQESTDIDTDIP